MEKSVFSEDYADFLRYLRAVRKRAGLTQQQVADHLGQTQSFVSKCERGERRIDIVELRCFCRALGTSLTDFATGLSKQLDRKR